MRILKITREDSFVQVRFAAKGPVTTANNPEDPKNPLQFQSSEDREITAYDAPLKSFDKAFHALADLVVKVLELPKDWKAGLQIRSVTFSYTKAGSRSVAITFLKDLDTTGLPHRLATPSFRIDDDTDNGRSHVTKPQAALVNKVVDETLRYLKGERQQASLGFSTAKKPGRDDSTGDLGLGDI